MILALFVFFYCEYFSNREIRAFKFVVSPHTRLVSWLPKSVGLYDRLDGQAVRLFVEIKELADKMEENEPPHKRQKLEGNENLVSLSLVSLHWKPQPCKPQPCEVAFEPVAVKAETSSVQQNAMEKGLKLQQPIPEGSCVPSLKKETSYEQSEVIDSRTLSTNKN